MVLKAMQLACANEHGFGDIYFPGDEIFNPELSSVRKIRREAKAQGWSVVNGEDYCDICTAGFEEEKLAAQQDRRAAAAEKRIRPGKADA